MDNIPDDPDFLRAIESIRERFNGLALSRSAVGKELLDSLLAGWEVQSTLANYGLMTRDGTDPEYPQLDMLHNKPLVEAVKRTRDGLFVVFLEQHDAEQQITDWRSIPSDFYYNAILYIIDSARNLQQPGYGFPKQEWGALFGGTVTMGEEPSLSEKEVRKIVGLTIRHCIDAFDDTIHDQRGKFCAAVPLVTLDIDSAKEIEIAKTVINKSKPPGYGR